MGILDDATVQPSCLNCHWWQGFTGEIYGECHRHAPLRLIEDENCHWPVTKSEVWCGDHAPAAK